MEDCAGRSDSLLLLAQETPDDPRVAILPILRKRENVTIPDFTEEMPLWRCLLSTERKETPSRAM
jgi:hypothetical protein